MPGSVRRDHQAARLQAIRRRFCSNTHLEDQGISTPAAIGAVAKRLGLEVPLEGLNPAAGTGKPA